MWRYCPPYVSVRLGVLTLAFDKTPQVRVLPDYVWGNGGHEAHFRPRGRRKARKDDDLLVAHEQGSPGATVWWDRRCVGSGAGRRNGEELYVHADHRGGISGDVGRHAELPALACGTFRGSARWPEVRLPYTFRASEGGSSDWSRQPIAETKSQRAHKSAPPARVGVLLAVLRPESQPTTVPPSRSPFTRQDERQSSRTHSQLRRGLPRHPSRQLSACTWRPGSSCPGCSRLFRARLESPRRSALSSRLPAGGTSARTA